MVMVKDVKLFLYKPKGL